LHYESPWLFAFYFLIGLAFHSSKRGWYLYFNDLPGCFYVPSFFHVIFRKGIVPLLENELHDEKQIDVSPVTDW
jgi:hypothetical protein